MKSGQIKNESPVLQASNLTVEVDGRHLISGVDLTIHSGEIHAIVGPNGAGKTTLLNAITNDLLPTAGKIQVCGLSQTRSTHLNTADVKRRAKSLAILPQLSLLNFPYRVEEVVSLGRTPHSTGLTIDLDIVQQAMKAMDISHLSERNYTQLSGGEKQRVQLARVMTQIWRNEDATERLLLLDEPTTALDIGHQQQLMDAVVEFAKQGVAVLMVVHDINIAAHYANYTLALANGKCLAQGKTEDIVKEDILSTLFNAKIAIVNHPVTNKPFVVS